MKIITLAIAFASSILVLVFAWGELGYDEFHADASSVVRVLKRNEDPSFQGNRLSDVISKEAYATIHSRVKHSMLLSRVKAMDQIMIHTGNRNVIMDHVYATDASITSILKIDLTAGQPDSFNNKRSVLLSVSVARQWFDQTLPVGQKITMEGNDTLTYVIAGVFADFPSNASERLDVIIKYESNDIERLGFNPDESRVYGRLLHPATASQMEQALRHIVKEQDITYRMQSLPSVYFGPRVIGEGAKHGDYYSVLILVCIAGFIFLLALTNFINLTTLTLPKRSKELGIRKIAGGTPWHLSSVLLHESFYVSLIALTAAILMLLFASHRIQAQLAIDVTSSFLDYTSVLWLAVIGLFILVGIAPLWTSLRFIKASAGRLLSTDAITFPHFKRNITIIQLGISISLIIAGLVIERQISYSLIKEPGLNYDQVVYINYPEGMSSQSFHQLRTQWKRHPNILDVTATSALPNQIQSKELDTQIYSISMDYTFPEFFNLQLASGRWYGPNDVDSLVVNQAALLQPGYNRYHNKVIGVVQNFGDDYHQVERPVVLRLAKSDAYHFICVRVLEVDIRKTMDYLHRSFETYGDASISFMNKAFEESLNYENRLNRFSAFLTMVSAIIACCSIYSLSLSRARDKMKQIALRKVMGAGSFSIVLLLVREFVQQLMIAILIFGPCIYIFLNEWLRNFVYATDFNWADPLISLGYCTAIVAFISSLQVISLGKGSLVNVLRQPG